MSNLPKIIIAVVAAVLVSMFAVACGSDDAGADATTGSAAAASVGDGAAPTGTADEHTESEAGTAEPPAETEESTTAAVSRVTVILGSPDEFSLVPSVTSIPAGEAVFTAVNEGTVEHELVMVRTDKDAADLAPEDRVHGEEQGRVNEQPEHQEPGTSARFRVNLEPGHYVLYCNVEGHYQAGQYANFVVT